MKFLFFYYVSFITASNSKETISSFHLKWKYNVFALIFFLSFNCVLSSIDTICILNIMMTVKFFSASFKLSHVSPVFEYIFVVIHSYKFQKWHLLFIKLYYIDLIVDVFFSVVSIVCVPVYKYIQSICSYVQIFMQ